mgnify:CR=1 FL=1
MKVAIVHEWLDTYAGSERVVEQLIAEWPEADLFAVCDFLPEAAAERLDAPGMAGLDLFLNVPAGVLLVQ